MICTQSAGSIVCQTPAKLQPAAFPRAQVSYTLLPVGCHCRAADHQQHRRPHAGVLAVAAMQSEVQQLRGQCASPAIMRHPETSSIDRCDLLGVPVHGRWSRCVGHHGTGCKHVSCMVAATAARADAGIQVEAGGISFPLVRTFWTGDAQRNLGAAVGFPPRLGHVLCACDCLSTWC